MAEATSGIAGFGVTLAGGTAGTIAKILSITVGGRKLDFEDVSSADSPDGFREFVPTLCDPGEITMDLGFPDHAANVNALDGAWQGKTMETWTVTFPDGSKWSCTGGVSNPGDIKADHNGKVTVTGASIKLTGKPTFTPATL